MYYLVWRSVTFTNSVDPDEMPHYGAFHLGLNCLYKYLLKGVPYTKAYVVGAQKNHLTEMALLSTQNWC